MNRINFASRMLLLLLLPPLLLMGGCASSGPKHAELADKIPEIVSGEGRIYFYRDSSILGAAIQPDIRLNGEAVGSSTPGGFFFVDRPSGKYVVSTTTEVENKIEFSLEDGQTRYIKTYISFGLLVGRVYPELVERDQALSVMGDLHYIGAPEHISGSGKSDDSLRPALPRQVASPRRAVEMDDLKDLMPAQR